MYMRMYNNVFMHVYINHSHLISYYESKTTGIGLLQPVFQITDPYLNLFRGWVYRIVSYVITITISMIRVLTLFEVLLYFISFPLPKHCAAYFWIGFEPHPGLCFAQCADKCHGCCWSWNYAKRREKNKTVVIVAAVQRSSSLSCQTIL